MWRQGIRTPPGFHRQAIAIKVSQTQIHPNLLLVRTAQNSLSPP